jgi:CMP-N-acetylneuraminic acid synthetase
MAPLNKKGLKIRAAMEKFYGSKEKGDAVFYASENKGNIKGVTKKKKKSPHKNETMAQEKREKVQGAAEERGETYAKR